MAQARDEATLRIGKLQKLLPLAIELHEKLGATLREMEDLAGGGAGVAAKLKQVEFAWQTAWSARYHTDYVFNFARDRGHWKRLLHIHRFTPEDLQVRILNYIRNDDPFYAGKRHPFNIFVASINAHTGAADAPEELTLEAPTVSDCRHSPRCRSDQEHTRKKLEEMRA